MAAPDLVPARHRVARAGAAKNDAMMVIMVAPVRRLARAERIEHAHIHRDLGRRLDRISGLGGQQRRASQNDNGAQNGERAVKS